MLSAQIIRILFLIVLSSVIAFILTPIFTNFMYKRKWGKQISDDKKTLFFQLHGHKEGTPTMGGVIIWVTVLIVTFGVALLSHFFDGFFSSLNFLSRAQTYLPLGALVGAALVGLIDDILGVLRIGAHGGGIHMKYKMFIYGAVAAIGAWWFVQKLGWTMVHIPFLGDFNFGIWFVPFFVFILVASAMSANETDGLDGLASGVLLIAFSCFLIVCVIQGKYDLAAFLAVIIGGLLTFLWYNINPARFFMGDTGAMSLGIVLGVVSILTNTVFLLPFFAFILVLESTSVIIQVFSRKVFKKRVFKIAPIHHHFEALGWPETKVTMRFWILAAVAAGLGMILFFLDNMTS